MKLTGWRALGAALVAGALAALAMPPLYWLPLAIVGIVAYVWLWQAAPTPLSAFWRGLAWGTGHFAVGSYWILEAFYVPPADFALLGPPIVAGLAVVLGFFPGFAGWASRRIIDRWPALAGRYSRLVVLAIAWTLAEWLRGHIFTGYPWNPLAHVWGFATPLLQGAALFGVYGLGMLTFLVLAAPTAGWRASIAALVVVGLAGWAGQSAMAAIESGQGNGAWIRIVQPNVPQSQKWRPETRAGQLTKLVEMSRQPGFDRMTAVVWPETAAPEIIEPGSAALAIMAQAVPPGGLLLTGAARRHAAARGRRVELAAGGRRGGHHCRPLRQGPPRAARRVHPLPQAAGAGLRHDRPRLVRGRRGKSDAGAIERAAVLLTDHLL
jgi:apolipoprotein N-acyltransferase